MIVQSKKAPGKLRGRWSRPLRVDLLAPATQIDAYAGVLSFEVGGRYVVFQPESLADCKTLFSIAHIILTNYEGE